MIVRMAMDAKAGGNEVNSDTVEPGRANQCHFLYRQNLKDEAEAWLDITFNGLFLQFGADIFREILVREAHMRREYNVRPTKQINIYFDNLSLNSVKE